jgi:5-methylcytosine-specific restriction endonuclease McrA
VGRSDDRGAIGLAEQILLLLDQGRFTTTYKYAVLLGLMDLCLENTAQSGAPPEMVTTRQLAMKVVELYWPQVAPFADSGGILRQTRGRPDQRATILARVEQLRDAAAAAMPGTPTVRRAEVELGEAYRRCVDEVEWTLIRYPLVLLQRVGGEDTRFLYEIFWDERVREGAVRRYQRGERDAFDNAILFRPGVPQLLVQLNGLLRPLIHQQWAADVARINQLDETRLHAHLFGAERRALTALRAPLLELQRGLCFYCCREVRTTAEVDHFLPWSRHPDDAIENLVVADRSCNNDKRDFLASADHVGRWRERASPGTALHHQLVDIAAAIRWDHGDGRTLSVARAIYGRLPEDARLWAEPGRFVPASRAQLDRALGIGA